MSLFSFVVPACSDKIRKLCMKCCTLKVGEEVGLKINQLHFEQKYHFRISYTQCSIHRIEW